MSSRVCFMTNYLRKIVNITRVTLSCTFVPSFEGTNERRYMNSYIITLLRTKQASNKSVTSKYEGILNITIIYTINLRRYEGNKQLSIQGRLQVGFSGWVFDPRWIGTAYLRTTVTFRWISGLSDSRMHEMTKLFLTNVRRYMNSCLTT